jgi:hypothetical protein
MVVELATISSTIIKYCMSNEQAKFLNSHRRHKTDVHIARQLAIAKKRGGSHPIYDKQPHRLAKHHAMDCGTPGCTLCGNPRRNAWLKKDRLTAQEKRLFQDVEKQTDKHSNGLTTSKDSE